MIEEIESPNAHIVPKSPKNSVRRNKLRDSEQFREVNWFCQKASEICKAFSKAGGWPKQYYICKSMSLWATEKQASRETTNISKANDLLTTLSRKYPVSAVIPFEGVTPRQK
jgi:hypothetical protein